MAQRIKETPEEPGHRTNSVSRGEQQPRVTTSEGPVLATAPEQLITIVFDDEAEYVRFTDFVYDTFQGLGMSFTDVPVATSVRVAPWLLDRAQQEHFHPCLIDDKDRVHLGESTRNRRAFDVESLRDFHVPDTSR